MMLDIKELRNNFGEIKEQLQKRGENIGEIDRFQELDKRRRELIQETETLKQQRNEASQQVAQLKREKKDADEVIKKTKEASAKIKDLDVELREIEEELETLLLTIPNIPHESVPVGSDEDDNEEIRTYGEIPSFSFEAKAHWDLATELGIVEFERASKVTGSRFAFYKGAGARLERALVNFMMDLHEDEHGYEEVLPPYMVNRTSMTGTGQLPKFEEDAFKIREEDYFLIPTAEVPVTNLHRDEILNGEELPIGYTAFSACFRSEAAPPAVTREDSFVSTNLTKWSW